MRCWKSSARGQQDTGEDSKLTVQLGQSRRARYHCRDKAVGEQIGCLGLLHRSTYRWMPRRFLSGDVTVIGKVPQPLATDRQQRGRQMADNFDTCLAFTLKAEGGYLDNPADPGGSTNMGITLATYRQWSDDPNLGTLQVQDMSERTARAIYRSLYWNPLRADALPAGLDLSVFDMGVNAGIWASARLLQRALGFTGEEVDGCVGPETLGAAAKCDARALVNDLAERQTAYYETLSDFPTFGTGWLNRTKARRSAALAMVENTATRSA